MSLFVVIKTIIVYSLSPTNFSFYDTGGDKLESSDSKLAELIGGVVLMLIRSSKRRI